MTSRDIPEKARYFSSGTDLCWTGVSHGHLAFVDETQNLLCMVMKLPVFQQQLSFLRYL